MNLFSADEWRWFTLVMRNFQYTDRMTVHLTMVRPTLLKKQQRCQNGFRYHYN